MVDFEFMIKALRLAWIPRLLKIGQFNWKTVPDVLFKKYGGLGFLLTCINQPSLVFSWNKDNNNFVWLKMGKWVTKCSVNI